jgi:hypothetical protein
MWPFASRSNVSARRAAASSSSGYRPILEALENRLCPSGALSAPTILSATAVNATEASLSWTDVANETGFRILLWNGTAAVPIATVGTGVTSITISSLPAGEKVYLSVEAFDATDTADSAWSAVQLPTEPLTGATHLTATAVSPTEIDLNWTAAQGQAGYHILEYINGKDVVIATLAAGATHDAVAGLTPGTLYYFSVEAFNDTTTIATDWASARTQPQPITAPTNLTLTPGRTQVSLTWTAAQGATGYRVFEWINGQATKIGTTNANTTTFSATGLHASTMYWFYVEAYNASNSAATAWHAVTTTSSTNPLLPPGNLTAQALGHGSVKLTWTGSHGAAGYYVYRWTGTRWRVVATLGPSIRTVTVSGLPTGSTQYFLVMAFTNSGAYAASGVVAITA